jgi:hypothetical protein
MIKSIICIVAIFVISLLFSSADESAYKLIESSTPGILGAILGGLTAAVSVIFSVLISATTSTGAVDKLDVFKPFFQSLKHDLITLLVCLVLSLILPYFRVTGIPVMVYPIHELLPSRDVFYTALELTLIVISFAVVVEVVNVMFSLVSNFSTVMKKEE